MDNPNIFAKLERINDAEGVAALFDDKLPHPAAKPCEGFGDVGVCPCATMVRARFARACAFGGKA